MHPDLQALQTRYKELAEAAQNQHISVEDATATLNALSVTDGSGAVWRMDIYGAFNREPYPGAGPQPADPSGFVEHEVAPATDPVNPFSGAPVVQDSFPPANQFGGTPNMAPANPFGGGTFEPNPADRATFGSGPAAGGFGANGGFQGTDPGVSDEEIYRPTEERGARSLATAGMPSPLMQKLLAVKEFVMRNIIVVVIIAVIVGILIFRSDGSKENQVPTTQEPETSQSASPSATPTAPPTSTGGPVPSAAVVEATRKALISGSREKIASLSATADPADVAVSAAFFAGIAKTGLTLDATQPVAEDGKAVATWRVLGSGFDPISVQVTWVQVSGTWLLETPPTLP